MFSTSSQKEHWIFPDCETLKRSREETNRRFIQKQRTPQMSDEEAKTHFLSPEEERSILTSYEYFLREFCVKFQPPMNKAVIGTSFHYFKRFYIYNSVMDYHPKEILVTCVYLACKIEEFNLSITQFVANVRGDREKATDIILNNELLLMSALKFHLTIHNPYRPVEGLLIDIKTRFPHFDAEILRPYIDDFLDKVLMTDIPLLYAPSQIALASILEAGRKCKAKIDPYVTDTLVTDQNLLPPVVEAVRTIRKTVRPVTIEPPNREVMAELNRKLEKCRNQDNNPDSATYKSRLRMDDDDMSEEAFDKFDDSFNQM